MIALTEIMDWAHVRHVPVVAPGGGVVGIISHRDLLHAAISRVTAVSEAGRARFLWSVSIAQLMRTQRQTIGSQEPVRKAASLMRHSKIGRLPVLADGQLAGTISKCDLLGIVEKM
jgi:CBS domain-containing protein